jgi:hypothetical protein
MRKLGLFTAILSTAFLTSCNLDDVLKQGSDSGLGGLTESEMVDGLKTALVNGIVHGSNEARGDQVKLDGYLRDKALEIVLPPDVLTAYRKADSIDQALGGAPSTVLKFAPGLLGDLADFRSLKDSLARSINRAAAHAAPASVDIFKTAITDMSLVDAKGLLFTKDSVAATSYLRGKTFSPLQNLFEPMVDNSLNVVKANQVWESSAKNWNSMVKSYQSLMSNSLAKTSLQVAGVKMPYQSGDLDTLNVDLGNYVTEKGLQGLFVVVGREETKIRRDPVSYVTDIGSDILERVFGEVKEELGN